MNAETGRVLEEVYEERRRQDLKWGQQDHDAFVWLGILMEEVGEVARAALEAKFTSEPQMFQAGHIAEYRKELTHVAAVAAAMIECLDRAKEKETTEDGGQKTEDGGRKTETVYPEARSTIEVVR
jgi:NTP pyrophosphatase (non-canonical NTP hydrolase)